MDVTLVCLFAYTLTCKQGKKWLKVWQYPYCSPQATLEAAFFDLTFSGSTHHSPLPLFPALPSPLSLHPLHCPYLWSRHPEGICSHLPSTLEVAVLSSFLSILSFAHMTVSQSKFGTSPKSHHVDNVGSSPVHTKIFTGYPWQKYV